MNPSKDREMRSFLMSRDPSIDGRYRPRPNKKARLFENIPESTESSDAESESTTFDDYEDEPTVSTTAETTETSEMESGPQVFLRLRPVDMPSKSYSISDCGAVLITNSANENCANNSLGKSQVEKHYSFTSIFDQYTSQRYIFEKCVGPKIQEEESVSIMAYGTSGSGKTFTLLGNDDNPGIIPRALNNIFKMYAANIFPRPQLKLQNARTSMLEDDASLKELQIRRHIISLCPDVKQQYAQLQQVMADEHNFETVQFDGTSVMIWISFVELYNECVYDLLTIPPRQANVAEGPRKNLKIICNKGQVFIKGVNSIFVKDCTDALKLLRFGQQRLTYASTAVNSNSSRSHCIFFVDILKFHKNGLTTQTSYKFCDLAGSERVDKTGTVGSRLKEAQRINTSLMILGRCLDAASTTRKKTNPEVIPFRESKLTMLLQAPLLGKERLAMIVTVSPLEKYYEENLNVLSFASIAKNIIFKAPPIKQHKSRYSAINSEAIGYDREYIAELEDENSSLRAENERLRCENLLQLQLQEEKLRKELCDRFEQTSKTNLEQFEQRMENKLLIQRREFEAMMALQKRKYEEKIEDLQDEIDDLKNTLSDVEIIDDE